MNKKNLIFCGLILFLFSAKISAEGLRYKGFSGGAMLNTGYIQGKKFEIFDNAGSSLGTWQPKGMPFGIGGAVRLHFGDHLRVGSEGYVSTLDYKPKGSFASVGWGGVLVDAMWQIKRVAPFVGATIGGGSYQNLTLAEPYADDFIEESHASFRKYPVFALVPFTGLEVMLTTKIRLVFKVDYFTNLLKNPGDFVSGPRFFFGFMFYRMKNDD